MVIGLKFELTHEPFVQRLKEIRQNACPYGFGSKSFVRLLCRSFDDGLSRTPNLKAIATGQQRILTPP
jgi:hypothetical protein